MSALLVLRRALGRQPHALRESQQLLTHVTGLNACSTAGDLTHGLASYPADQLLHTRAGLPDSRRQKGYATAASSAARRGAAQLLQLRSFSEGQQTDIASSVPPSHLSEEDYHEVADHTMEDLVEKVEEYVESLDFDGDVEYSQGVLTVKLGPHGTYVINKQTPNRQIWMSSPVSGPMRYDYVAPGGDASPPDGDAGGGQWVYSRDGHEFLHRLEEELPQLCGRPIRLR